MRQPSPSIVGFALRLLRHESAGSQEPLVVAAAADRAFEKLRAELETLVGPGGASALYRRARTLARRQFPFLDGRRIWPDVASSEAALDFRKTEK